MHNVIMALVAVWPITLITLVLGLAFVSDMWKD